MGLLSWNVSSLERYGLAELIGRTTLIRRGYTLLVIIIGWVLFRADGFAQALWLLRAMAGMAHPAGQYPIQWFLTSSFLVALTAGIIFSAPVVPALLRKMERMVQVADESHKFAYVSIFAGLRIAGACAAMVLRRRACIWDK